jgi:predicted Zn-dependent protease
MKLSSINGVLRIERKLLALLLLVANSAALAQLSWATTDDPPCSAAFPTSHQWRKETMSGKKLAVELEQHVTLIKDPYMTSYLNRLEQNIVHNSGLHGCFVVKVVKDVEVNAYSLPGGFLYVTSGLILTATDEAELVGALAHETGHVTARHLTKIVSQKRRWHYLSLLGGPPGYLLGRKIGPLVTLKTLRDAEFEADRLALRYQHDSGYDPLEFARLLEEEFSQEGTPPSFFARLFDEHPSTQARIERIKQAAQFSLFGQDYVVDTSEFHDVKSRIAAVMGIANPE